MKDLIREHDVVALLDDMPEEGLSSGDTGTIVHIHQEGKAFEVEFPAARENGMGGVVTVEAGHLLRLRNLKASLAS
jgi:hypothetical protein